MILKFQISKFLKNVEILVSIGPYGEKNAKLYSSYSYDSFPAKLFPNVPCVTILTEVTKGFFEISNFNLKKKD